MDRNEKRKQVEELKSIFEASGSVVMTAYQGMTVAELNDLRAQLRKENAKVRIVKNRLAKIALKGTSGEGAADLFSGPVAICFAEDMLGAPKVAVKFAKDNDNFEVLGGITGEEVVDIAGVVALSTMPSREEMLAGAVQRLLGQASEIVSRLNSQGSSLAGAINVIGEKATA